MIRLCGLFLLFLIMLLLTTGCGRYESAAALTEAAGHAFSNVLPITGSSHTPYYAEQIFADFSESPPKYYHEKVWLTKDGRFRCICTGIEEQLDGSRVPGAQRALDSYNQRLRYGSGSHHVVFDRGFRIKDTNLFLQNYNYSILHPNKTYLDRKAVVVRITSRQMDRPGYTVWLDKETGLVLKYSEDTLAMDPLYTFEITKLDLNPDFAGVEFTNWTREEDVLEESGLASAFDFDVYLPLYVPEGFYPDAPVKWTIKRSAGDVTAFRLSYTDGVQTLSMVQTAPLGLAGTIKGTRMDGGLPSAADNSSNLSRKNSSRGRKTVLRESVGLNVHSKAGLRSLIFQVEGTAFTLRAKIHEEDLMTFIQSMVPANR